MLKNPKAKGSRNERRSMKLYEAKGFVCQRAAGSLGIFDFVAFGMNGEGVVFVQVKSNRPPPKKEMESIVAFPSLFVFSRQRSEFMEVFSRKEIHVWKDYKREPIITEVK